ncbi:hypothetical protein GUITHDRAFT_107525 [Guillardia theta CCMP2712]|uniref:Uncharacterized protein n=1 Tax=Guillardia theta (strain CCMP2712) TaxID=905079 RepID=L1JF40_GUITC|nr:hypothetical protein GUITHDRAFT_107525 [Guillardia theta CCMP2712]EKX46749.1 hypothetical protein GUITHDRAFT_107525 [Guillardia theta CCMP2712]|eukprot:XP_005833729.1 hypothetical protein GUITHDRAFT_107525 [Guillardia theta CCMP2712]
MIGGKQLLQMLNYEAGVDPTQTTEPFFAGMHTVNFKMISWTSPNTRMGQSSNPAASPHVLGAGFVRGHPTFSSLVLPQNIVYHPTNHPKDNWWMPEQF